MLSPFPKSTVISPGTPRKACITSRWSVSVTGELIEELTDRLRPVAVWAVQELLETRREIRREVFQRFEQRQKELLHAWTGHAALLGRTGNVPEAYEEPMPGVNRAHTSADPQRGCGPVGSPSRAKHPP